MRQADGEALVLALDEGSTGVRAMLLDRTGTPRGIAYRETLPDHPGPGLVEHDAERLFAATADVIREVLAGRRYVSPGMTQAILQQIATGRTLP